MSINALTQPHPAQAENTLAHASPKAQNGGSKANTAQATGNATPAQQAQETKAAEVAQNNAGHEQGNPQKNGGQGGHVNLYA